MEGLRDKHAGTLEKLERLENELRTKSKDAGQLLFGSE